MASPSESKLDDTEVTSEPNNNSNNQEQQLELPFPLTRQPSIYSLTLDEIQNTVFEPGKGFGSMNMDEFLNNIWNVEEGAANNSDNAAPDGTGGGPPLHRQGSIALPAPLCRKTVEEVWAEIHRERDVSHLSRGARRGGNSQNAHRRPTFGEMTLEDFLVKAGVVRDGVVPGSPHPVPLAPMQHNYGLSAGYPVVGPAGYEYQAHHGKRYGNGLQNVGVGSPVSPASEDGFGGGPVERRQRRMIKNRESAARSRARKQAYTVELEAELNLLKEENARLIEEKVRAQALRKEMITECMAEHARANAAKTARCLRRCNSSP